MCARAWAWKGRTAARKILKMVAKRGEGPWTRERRKAQVRIRKVELSKFVPPMESLEKRRQNSAPLDENDPVEYAVETRRLCNAARDRTSRVLVRG